jgi:hypothetical protein
MVPLIRNLTRHGLWPRSSAVTFAGMILCVAAALPCVHAQVSTKPLSQDEVITLLKGDVSSKRVAELVQQRGINFVVTPGIEQQLRRLGATDSLVARLKTSVPKPAATVPLPGAGELQIAPIVPPPIVLMGLPTNGDLQLQLIKVIEGGQQDMVLQLLGVVRQNPIRPRNQQVVSASTSSYLV